MEEGEAEWPAGLFVWGFRGKHTALQSRIAPPEEVSCGNTLRYRARLSQYSGSGGAEKGFRSPIMRGPISLDSFKDI